MSVSDFAPVTPGEMLKDPNRIAEIVNNRRRITADTALRLALYFGNTPEFWLNLQTHFDLKMARQDLPPDESALSDTGRHNADITSGWHSMERGPLNLNLS